MRRVDPPPVAVRGRRRPGWIGLALAAVLAGTSIPGRAEPVPAHDGAVERGAYLFAAAGCAECHTDVKHHGAPLAGGRALKTPFGTFYSPNITPDRTDGIGRWSDADFIRALRFGIGPDGRHYFPVFPYPSFTNMTDDDMRDLKAYLFAQAPVARPDTPHDIKPPFGIRLLMRLWDRLFLRPGPLKPDPARSAQWNRGAYLVRALGHCGECHTPRNLLGAMEPDRFLAGSDQAPEGTGSVPNITPDKATGIGDWDAGDITYLLKTGFKPDGDVVGGAMSEVVNASTSKLSDADRAAIAAYLRSVPAISHAVGKAKSKAAGD